MTAVNYPRDSGTSNLIGVGPFSKSTKAAKLRPTMTERGSVSSVSPGILRSLYRALPFKLQLFELLRRGPTLPNYLYQHMHFEGPFDVTIDSEHKFRIHSYTSHIENELFWVGYGHSWEGMSLQVWAALCRSCAGKVLDIGANTGVYALAAAAL